jgi:hypothetical protein
MERLAVRQIANFDEFRSNWRELMALESICNPTIACTIQINILIKFLLDAEFLMLNDQIDVIRICKESLLHPQSVRYTKFIRPKQSTSDNLYSCKHQLGS